MAQVSGSRAHYPWKEAQRRLLWGVTVGVIATALAGVFVGYSFRRFSMPVTYISTGLYGLAGAAFLWWLNRAGNQYVNYLVAIVGEDRTALVLDDLPDSFHVIHGIETPSGDIDHIVVGPTGVFCIDTKNWAARVESNGHGELTRDGRPTSKREVARFIARVMELRDRLTGTGPPLPFFQTTFVFPQAAVKQQFMVQNLDCLPIGELLAYLQRPRPTRAINAAQVQAMVEVLRAYEGVEAAVAG